MTAKVFEAERSLLSGSQRTSNPERGNMRSAQSAEALTASEPISTALEDGSIVEGTLGFHPSRRGCFKVSYAGKSKMETRSYMGVEYMRSGAMVLLRGSLTRSSLTRNGRCSESAKHPYQAD